MYVPHLYSAISRVPTEAQSADILSSLFGETCDSNSAPAQRAVDGRDVSISLFLFPVRQWSIRSAFVCNDKLIVSARREHCSVLKVYQSSSITQFGEHKLPVFSNCILFQHEIGSCSVPSKGLLSTTIAYKPVLSFLCCQSSVKSDRSTLSVASSATDVFFRQLFGFELSLARSTVAIVGTESGTVLFLDTRGYCTHSPAESGASLSNNTLCNLGQPVVAVHPLCLPTHPEHQQSDDSSANSLLVVGRLGKLVLLTEAEKGREAPLVTEFSVTGPILSSFLVERHSFVYSNTSGIYRICLEPSCLLKSLDLDASSTTSVVVPRSQFHSPCPVSATCMSFIIGASPPTLNEACSATVISIDGKLLRFRLESCQNTVKVTKRLDIGREMRESMDSINKTGQRNLTAQSQLKLVDSALMELNQALSVLHSVQSSDGRVFSCTVSPVTDRVGVRHLALGGEVELCYTGLDRLQRGWALLITTQCTSSNQSRYTTLSLAGLAPNDVLKHRVKLDLETGMPATFSVAVAVCYSPTPLQSILTQLSLYTPPKINPCRLLEASGVAFPLAYAVFDALDFIQPCSPELIHRTFASNVPHTPQQGHSFEMVLPNPNQRAEVSSDTALPVHSCRGVLDVLLPHNITESLSTGNNGPFQIQACSYDGSIVSFEINSREESCLLKIKNTGSVRSMVEIMSSICCRCQGREVSRFPVEVATSLQVFTATRVCLVSSQVFLHSIYDR